MSIEDHIFSDEDVTLRGAYDDTVDLDCDLADIGDCKYITLSKNDVIELAKLMDVTKEDLEGVTA